MGPLKNYLLSTKNRVNEVLKWISRFISVTRRKLIEICHICKSAIRYWPYIRSFIVKYWLYCLTFVFVVLAVIIPFFAPTLENAAYIGDYLSGFAAALAFIWLIASFRIQSQELTLQRNELALQRQAIELQTKEIQSMGEYAALEQVANIVNGAVQKLAKSKSGVTQPEQLFEICVPSSDWATMLQSRNPQEVHKAYLNWGSKYGAATQFLASMTIAAKLYLRGSNNTSVDYTLSDDQFFYINKCWIEKIPHISEYFHSTYLVAEAVFMLGPGIKSLHLAGVTAVQQLFGRDVFDKKYVEELISYHRERGLKGPAIANLSQPPS